MPQCMTENNIDKLSMKIRNATKGVAESSKKDSAAELKEGSDVTDVSMSPVVHGNNMDSHC